MSCIDQCFIADDMLEQLPAASQVGKTTVGGIDLNKTRMRAVVEAVIALSASPNGFTASDIAARVRQRCAPYGPRHAAYDLKKLRGKHIVCRIGTPAAMNASGLRAITALLLLRNKAIKPSLPPPDPSTRPAARSTPNPSMPITTPSRLPCRAFSTIWGSPLDDRQDFCRASPRSA